MIGKIRKFSLHLLIGAAFLLSENLCASSKKSYYHKRVAKSDLSNIINSKVLETIRYSENIPGLKSENFAILKTEIIKTWDTLLKEGALEVSATDREVRPYFVALQGVIEHVLASQLQREVKSLKGFIHTPMPTTPLCTNGEISKELVDPSIELDSARLFTVKARTTILRDYLFKNGDLYVVYPEEGLKMRTKQQQEIYKKELINYPTHLFNVPLESKSIPRDLIGATYLFQDFSGNTYVFAIKMSQANDPREEGNFGLWFGPLDYMPIKERVDAISSYMKQNGSNILEVITQ